MRLMCACLLLIKRPWDELKPYRVGGQLRNGSEELGVLMIREFLP